MRTGALKYAAYEEATSQTAWEKNNIMIITQEREKTMATKTNSSEVVVEMKPLEIVQTTLHVEGITPLIMHAWSDKAIQQMLDAQMGKAKGKEKEKKNPMEDFIRSAYWLTPMPAEYTEEAFQEAIANGARFGFPVTAFKQAAISAAYRLGWVRDKMGLRGAFFINADANTVYGSALANPNDVSSSYVVEKPMDMVEIHSDAPIMREDMVRIGMGTADIRYRAEFRNWSADLKISYNKSGQFSLDSIVNIINAGGYVCGVGEWRPERDGSNGQFMVKL